MVHIRVIYSFVSFNTDSLTDKIEVRSYFFYTNKL